MRAFLRRGLAAAATGLVLLAAPAAAQPAADPIAGRLAAIAAAYGTADPAGLDRSRRRALAAALTGESLTILAGRPDLVDPLRAALERTAPQAAPEVLARLAAALPGYAARLAPGGVAGKRCGARRYCVVCRAVAARADGRCTAPSAGGVRRRAVAPLGAVRRVCARARERV